LRQDYEAFTTRGAEILVIGPDGPHSFARYWAEHDMPFAGLADIRSRVARMYEQEVNLLKLGRMPSIFVVDYQGKIQFAHYGDSMTDFPGNEHLLEVIDQINQRHSIGTEESG
jgi:peroxiredoxin